MAKEKSKPRRKLDEKSIIIPGKSISNLKVKKKLTHAELAALLGVSPGTLTRWASDYEEGPTSTSFLVMIPLLLSMGEDLMPKYYEEIVTSEFESVFDASEMKKLSDKFKRLARERFLRTNPDLQQARQLFQALQEAWSVIDSHPKAER